MTDLDHRRVQTGVLLDLQRIRQTIETRTESLLDAQDLAVTPSQANVLMALFQAREPMTASQLACSLRVSDVTVGRFVRALEGSGWIDRRRDPRDSRAQLISPTDKARDALPRFIAVSNELVDACFDRFSRADVEDFARKIHRIRTSVEA